MDFGIQFFARSLGFQIFPVQVDLIPLLKGWSLSPFGVGILARSSRVSAKILSAGIVNGGHLVGTGVDRIVFCLLWIYRGPV